MNKINKSDLHYFILYLSKSPYKPQFLLMSSIYNIYLLLCTKTGHDYPTILCHRSPAGFLKCPFAVQSREVVIHFCITVHFESSRDGNWTWCCLFFSSHDKSFEPHYVISHQRHPFLKKKKVALVWLVNHSLGTTLDRCLQSTAIEFPHPGMKSSVFDGHTLRAE